MKRFALLTLVALAACNTPTDPITKPSVEFTGFVNTVTGIVIPATSNTVPANFVAQVRSSVSSTADRVTDVQCFNGATAVTTGVSYKTLCGYAGVTTGTVIKAAATSSGGTSEVSKTVTVDLVAPQASSIIVGGNVTTNPSPSLSALVNFGNVDLSVTSSDPDVLRTFIRIGLQTIAESNSNTASATITIAGTQSVTVTFGVIDQAGNQSLYTDILTVNKVVGDGKAPTVIISSPAAGTTVNGSITVKVDAADESGIESVDLLANNNPIATSSGQASPSFSIDTTKFVNGSLELKARAKDKSGLETTSSIVALVVQNVLGPTLQITSPTSNAVLTGATSVTVNIGKRSSDYTYVTDLKVEFFDYRGTSIGKRVIPLAGQAGDVNKSIFTTADPFDLNNFPNDLYNITASVTVNVVGEPGPRVVSDTITIKNVNTNLTPPAVIITHPVRLATNEQQLDTAPLPIFSQTSGFIVGNISDDKGIVSAELRLTCVSCGSLGPVNALEQYQAYIPPTTSATVLLGFDADGTPFLPNGIYIMRLVVQDTDGNRNIQEVKVKLSRNDSACASAYGFGIANGPDNLGDNLTPGSATATATGLVSGNSYRVASWVTAPGNSRSFGINAFSGATSTSFGSGFNVSGNWLFNTQIEDLTNGCIDNLADFVSVFKLKLTP
jgi:large repetitive protein